MPVGLLLRTNALAFPAKAGGCKDPDFRRFFESGLTPNYIGRLGRGLNLWAVMAGTNTKFIVPSWHVAARGPHVQASATQF
jgi:hypothetical protein